MEMKVVVSRGMVSRLLYYQVMYILFYRFLEDVFGFPGAISYGIDVINCFIVIVLLSDRAGRKRLFRAGLAPVWGAVVALIAFTAIDAMINLVKPQLYLWAFRNTMRYYPFFFSIIVSWNEKTLHFIVNFLIRLQYVNFLIVLIQYFVLGYRQDNIGGIFGHVSGCNGALNIYLCIVMALCIEKYIHREIRSITVLSTIVMFLVCIVFAELKIGFAELMLIIALAVVVDRPSIKLTVAVAAVWVLMPIAMQVMIQLFPHWASSFESIGGFLGVGSEVGGGYNISRFNAFSEINDLFFHGSIFRNVFGLGFGKCEYSIISFFSSSFYDQYGWLHYRWFTHQMWFLECGYLGIAFYSLFFITLFSWFAHQKKKYGNGSGMGSFGQIMIVLCGVIFIYNFTLRTEDGYMLYLALGLPCLYYLLAREKQMEG